MRQVSYILNGSLFSHLNGDIVRGECKYFIQKFILKKPSFIFKVQSKYTFSCLQLELSPLRNDNRLNVCVLKYLDLKVGRVTLQHVQYRPNPVVCFLYLLMVMVCIGSAMADPELQSTVQRLLMIRVIYGQGNHCNRCNQIK